MSISSPSLTWLAASIVCDVGESAYLKVAGDRLAGSGFFWATAVGVVVFAPSIIAVGYALRAGPSYITTVGVWAIGMYALNALLGIVAFGDHVGPRTAVGLVAACLAVTLLNGGRGTAVRSRIGRRRRCR